MVYTQPKIDVAFAAGRAALKRKSKSSAESGSTANPANGAVQRSLTLADAMADYDTDDDEIDFEGDSEVGLDEDGFDEESVYSDFTDCSELFWEEPGILHDHRENSYPNPARFRWSRSTQHGTINYDWCKPEELKRFVINRLLPDPYPQGVTLKYFYLRLLEKDDSARRFRFMDLPPEMRLMVCRNLLLLEARPNINRYEYNRDTLYPAILQTCRQVNHEASGILYDESTFRVVFVAGGGEMGIARAMTASVHKEFKSSLCLHAPWLRTPRGIDDYPEFFRRVSRLQVHLQFVNASSVELSENATWPLNHILYTLASFLMDGHRLKLLTLKLDISSTVEDSKYGMIFHPLRRLRNIGHVDIEGHIPDNIKARLIADVESSEPAFNTMRHWKLIADELQAQLDIHEAMHAEIECACGECPMPDCIEEISFRLSHLDDMGFKSGFSSRLEENFMAHLAGVRKFLNRAKIDKLKELVETLILKRQAMIKYERVSDDGRLDEAAKIWAGEMHDYSLKYEPEDDWSDDVDGTTGGKAAEEDSSKTSEPVAPALVLEASDLTALNESSSSSEGSDEEARRSPEL